MKLHYRNFASTTAILAIAGLTSCGTLDRLTNVGKPPTLSAIESPVEKPGYRPVRLPMPHPVAYSHQPNSLWRSGARSFFKDQRASRVGDILTINVQIDDKAELENTTSRSRTNNEDLGIDALGGAVSNLAKLLPTGAPFPDVVDVDSNASSQGTGSVDRTEAIETTVAAIVTQVLPNGNLVIEGKQEVRVNFEIRELIVAGIVRPEDISNTNTISTTQLAEARISYGGRGQISDVQQPRYGQQFLDIILPF